MTQEKVQITREFPYAISKVYSAFTNPGLAKKWLAPNQFTCEDIVYELQFGGRMHTNFVDVQGDNAKSEGKFSLIVPNSLIEYEFEVSYLDTQIENLRT